MVYVLERNIDENKLIMVELSKVFGLGRKEISKICHKFKISENVCINEIEKTVFIKIVDYINKRYVINLQLENELSNKISIENNIKSYRGLRRKLGLPLNGQRTKTNAKTVKGLLKK